MWNYFLVIHVTQLLWIVLHVASDFSQFSFFFFIVQKSSHLWRSLKNSDVVLLITDWLQLFWLGSRKEKKEKIELSGASNPLFHTISKSPLPSFEPRVTICKTNEDRHVWLCPLATRTTFFSWGFVDLGADYGRARVEGGWFTQWWDSGQDDSGEFLLVLRFLRTILVIVKDLKALWWKV